MSKEFMGFAAAPETITAAIGRRHTRLWCKPRGGNVSSFGLVLLDIFTLPEKLFFLNAVIRRPLDFPARTPSLSSRDSHGCLLLSRTLRRPL
jgi:hypothetical protein